MKILKSTSNDPVRNLTLEHRLLMDGDEDFLLLFINSPSVIVGRNQSPEAEADIDYCRCRGIPVVQRVSGGGAVYHDPGNINFSFIGARKTESLLDSRPLAPLIEALAKMGVNATVGTRGELRVGGLKISGTASYVTSSRQLFHGTLLFDTDLREMSRTLSGNPEKRGKKIPSVPSETMNLKTLLPSIPSPKAFMNRLAAELSRYFGAGGPEDIIY